MGSTLKVIVTGASYSKMEIEVVPYVKNKGAIQEDTEEEETII